MLTFFQPCRAFSWAEPVLSQDKCLVHCATRGINVSSVELYDYYQILAPTYRLATK